MLKYIFSIIFVFSLVSCGSSNENASWLTLVDKEDFSIQSPENWEILNSQDVLPKANKWDIKLTVSSTNSQWWYANNMIILWDRLTSLTSSKDYSMLNNVWAKSDYLEYTAIESKDILFSDGEESILYIFEAKYNYETPKIKFLQTASICNGYDAYFMTISIPSTVTDTSKYEYLLSTFSCKQKD